MTALGLLLSGICPGCQVFRVKRMQNAMNVITIPYDQDELADWRSQIFDFFCSLQSGGLDAEEP